MNEILLIIVIIAMLIIPPVVLKRLRQPINIYIKLSTGLLLLILVWFFADESSLPIKILMTTVIVSSAIRTIKDYLGFARQTKTGSN